MGQSFIKRRKSCIDKLDAGYSLDFSLVSTSSKFLIDKDKFMCYLSLTFSQYLSTSMYVLSRGQGHSLMIALEENRNYHGK